MTIKELLLKDITARIAYNEKQTVYMFRARNPVGHAAQDMRAASRSIAAATFIEAHYKNGRRIAAVNCTQQEVIDFTFDFENGFYD